ncbi:MAG: ABC transporter substrate-binding protein, partial [Gemmatimonadota bacterium]
MFASGADLQSINPLLTVHPLARQAQRYLLLTTLVRYDSALVITPYLARSMDWSPGNRELTFHLCTAVRWHDGQPTTSRDVKYTLDTARDPATGYPRRSDLDEVDSIAVLDDSTVVIRFNTPQAAIPDVLTDLAILPAHLLDTVPSSGLRSAYWNEHPVGNGPFRFVAHEPNRRWVFAANPDFPAELGGPPALQRFVIAVVDEPTTKLAALASGELDFAGINPAHAEFVRNNPRLEVVSYPLLLTYGIVFNARVAPFNDIAIRRAISRALDRPEIVNGFLYGFGTEAYGPVPPGIPGAVSIPHDAIAPDRPRELASRKLEFELLTVGSGEAALEQMIQSQLGRAGIKVTIRQLE